MNEHSDGDYFDFPPVDEADYPALLEALSKAALAMVEVGYKPNHLAAALATAGLGLAYREGGHRMAAAVLKVSTSVFAEATEISPIDMPAAGTA